MFVKKLFSTIFNILSTVVSVLTAVSLAWLLIPNFNKTGVGVWLQSLFPTLNYTYISFIIIAVYILILVIRLLLNVEKPTKRRNFIIHLNSFLLSGILAVLSIYAFITLDDIKVDEFIFSIPRRIALITSATGLVLFHIFSDKLLKVINRRIQSYETAKEMNTIGRGSIICTNLLKLFEFCFPELLLIAVVCCCVDWQIAVYFIIALCAFIVPTIGNMICDINIRREAKILQAQKDDAFAKKVATNMKGDK